MGNSGISYLDKFWSPVVGCSPSMRCAPHCWAAKLCARMVANPKLTREAHNAVKSALHFENLRLKSWSGRSALIESWLDAPLHWRKPQRIGVCFLGDLFAEAVPDEWIDRAFAVMFQCPQHQFYLLTKQPKRAFGYLRDERSLFEIAPQGSITWPLPNVRLGVSVCTQQEADERIPLLLQTPAAFRWMSVEPMLGEIDLTGFSPFFGGPQELPRAAKNNLQRLDWIVVGCESGPDRRPMPWKWAQSVVEQCKAAGVPCWVKQLDAGKDGVITPHKSVNAVWLWPAWAKQEQPA